jgi:hypothetical protein
MKKYLLALLILAAFGCESSKPEVAPEISPKAQKAKHGENINAFEARVKLLYPNSQVLQVASIGPVAKELDVYVYRVVGVIKYDLSSEYEPKQKWTRTVQLLCAEGACWEEPRSNIFGSND